MRKLVLPILLGLILSVFLFINIYSSQLFDSLLFKLLQKNEPGSVRVFLDSIQTTPYFSQQSRYFNGLYGNIFAEEESRFLLDTDKKIQTYSHILEQSPGSRDALIKLSMLYMLKKDPDKAKEYYNMAKDIDPWVYIPEIESQ